jgi:hypothetical protein
MKKYKNPEMRKAMQQTKEKPRNIKIISGSASTREQLVTSSKRAGSMAQSGLPKTTKVSAKSKPTTAVRATKRGTPVPMPKKPGKGPMARMTERATMPKPKFKGPKKPSKPVTERQLLDVKNMTPAEKIAYLKRGKRGF